MDDQKQYEKPLIRQSIGLLQDIAGSLKHDLRDYIQPVMEILTHIVQNNEYAIDVQNTAILVFGDVCLHLEMDYKPFLEETMNILIQVG